MPTVNEVFAGVSSAREFRSGGRGRSRDERGARLGSAGCPENIRQAQPEPAL